MEWLPYAVLASFVYLLYCFFSHIFYPFLSTLASMFLACLYLGWSTPPSPLTPVARFLTWDLGFLLFLLTPFPALLWCMLGFNPNPDPSPKLERMKVFDEIPKTRIQLRDLDVVEYVYPRILTDSHPNHFGISLLSSSLSIVAVHGLASNPETTWLARAPAESRTEHKGKSATTEEDDPEAVSAPLGKPSGWAKWFVDLMTSALRQLLLRFRSRPSKEKKIESRPNWLSDFLPRELHVRVMAYHHDSRWMRNALAMSLEDHAWGLLYAIRHVRENDGVRMAAV